MVLTGRFEANELLIFKIRTILERIGTKTLALLVRCSGEETVTEILKLCSQLLSQPRKKRQLRLRSFSPINPFDEDIHKAKQEIEENPTKATLDRFDITFLNKFLPLVPQDETIQDEAKELRKIVKLRNEFSHGGSAVKKQRLERGYEELEKSLPAALAEVERIGNARLSSGLSQNKRDEVEEALQEIQFFKIGLIDEIKRLRFCKIDELFTSAAEYLSILGHEELVKSYKNQEYVNPVAFLLGKAFSFHLDRFFTAPEFKLKDNEQIINFEEMLKTIECDPSCTLVEGPSGIGKTTFNRMLLAKKSSGERFQHLWIIPFECRNKRFDSLEEIIEDLFPEAAKEFTSEKLCRAIIGLRPLFLIDGLDERNEKSGKVITEILSCARKGEARFLATSRPEAMENFLSEMVEMNFSLYNYLELIGIPRDDLGSMVEKYCKVFSEAKACSFQVEKTLVDKVIGNYHSLLFESNSPLILCLITYLIVSKENNSENWETRTSLYGAILDAIYKKLKLRLRGKESYLFTERKYRLELIKFLDNLNRFSLTSLSMNQLVFSCDEIVTVEENLTSEFSEEAISAIFVIKRCFTIIGFDDFPTYSYPHKSFQEFLAAKQIFKEMSSFQQQSPTSGVPNVLKAFLHQDLEDKEEAILFMSGLLAIGHLLTSNLCNEIFTSLESRKYFKYKGERALQLIQESKEHPVMVELTSNCITKLYLNETSVKIANLVLQRDCPKLESVQLEIRTINEEIFHALRYLKDKTTEVTLRLNHEITNSTNILREIIGGRCILNLFQGRLDVDGAKILPSSLEYLHQQIVSEADVEALRYLSEISENYTMDQLEKNVDLKWLTIEIFDTCNVNLLPKRLMLAYRWIEVKLPSAAAMDRCLEIAEWLCRVKFRPGTRVTIDKQGAYFTREQDDQLAAYIKKHASDHMIHRNILVKTDFRKRSEFSGFFTEQDVEKFPTELEHLSLNICGPDQAAGLNSLVQRLNGGNNQHLKPIRISSLKIRIVETCDFKLLPQTLPTGSDSLHVTLQASSDLGGKFDWLLRVMERLPKREWCTVWLGSFDLDIKELEILLETLKNLEVKAELWMRDSIYKLPAFASLQNSYEKCYLDFR